MVSDGYTPDVRKNKKIFCLGVWDLLHQGHLILLEKAANLGELTVGVVRDKAVKKQKGDNRPVHDEYFRMKLLSHLRFVYDVYPLDDFSFPLDILRDFDIIIIGADQHHISNLADVPIMKRYDLPRTEGVSTSAIVNKLKE